MIRFCLTRNSVTGCRLFLFTFALFVAGAPALHGQRSLAKRAAAVVQTDFFLQTSDGILLDCTRFAPEGARPKKGWPVILYCHGYADSKDVELAVARDQAAFGYATYAYSMRGQGRSGGRSHLISRVEMRDLFEVVDAIKRDTLANGGRIAIYGSSQGGILPYMAACYGLDVRCILSDLASPMFASDWMANASPKITLFFTVDYDSLTVRYDDEVREIRRLILSKLPADRDSLAARLPRDRDFLERVDSCRVPLLITNAWQDKFFSANGSIAGAERLRSKNIVYIGAIDGHGADSTAKENRFISSLQNAWIEYWLNGIPHPLIDSARYQFAASHAPRLGRRWSFTHLSSKVWPPEGVAPAELFFRPDSALADRPPTASDAYTLENILRDTALTLQQGIDAQFRGPQFAARFPKQTLSFDSAPLAGDMPDGGNTGASDPLFHHGARLPAQRADLGRAALGRCGPRVADQPLLLSRVAGSCAFRHGRGHGARAHLSQGRPHPHRADESRHATRGRVSAQQSARAARARPRHADAVHES
ncbi:MAG: alpha/beta fold hydrolase [Ignavibacteria bacterium]|nr:alpha/beta fold hydrolase [Ignavibacteria bacterium]